MDKRLALAEEWPKKELERRDFFSRHKKVLLPRIIIMTGLATAACALYVGNHRVVAASLLASAVTYAFENRLSHWWRGY